jgi:hypothetical protein
MTGARRPLRALALACVAFAVFSAPALARPSRNHAAPHARTHSAPTGDATDAVAVQAESEAAPGADRDPLDMMWIDAPDETKATSPESAQAAAQRGHGATGVASEMAAWISANGDNQALPFAIIDKLAAKIFVFDVDGTPLGSAPILLGLARGDDSAPGVGGMKLLDISPEERTTPAGRFVAQYGPSDGHGTMLWVDFADAISMHPVMSVSPGEHRLARIRSATPGDHRISYGCINLPEKFYDDVVQPAFSNNGGVVYILPDTKPLAAVFPAFADAMGDTPHDRGGRLAEQDPLADPPGRVADAPPPEPTPNDP